MGDRRVRAFRRWLAKPAAASAAAPADQATVPAGAVDEAVTTGPLLATPLPQRQRVASAAPAGTAPAERTAPAEGGDIRDIAAMMDFLRREA
jgi:hypothetical protein